MVNSGEDIYQSAAILDKHQCTLSKKNFPTWPNP